MNNVKDLPVMYILHNHETKQWLFMLMNHRSWGFITFFPVISKNVFFYGTSILLWNRIYFDFYCFCCISYKNCAFCFFQLVFCLVLLFWFSTSSYSPVKKLQTIDIFHEFTFLVCLWCISYCMYYRR